jgi:hypothetical protein
MGKNLIPHIIFHSGAHDMSPGGYEVIAKILKNIERQHQKTDLNDKVIGLSV